MIRSALEPPWLVLYIKNHEKLSCLKLCELPLHLRKYEAQSPSTTVLNYSEMTILPQTLLKTVVDEVGWSQNFFSKKVSQYLSKTVSIVFLRPMVAEISIAVTRVVKPLTTNLYPTVIMLCFLLTSKGKFRKFWKK